MASVIASARNSSASLFDFVGATAGVLTQTVSVASRAVDTLDLKAEELHAGVLAKAASNIEVSIDREVLLACEEHMELLERIFKKRNPEKEFDYDTVYQTTYDRMHKAIEKRRK